MIDFSGVPQEVLDEELPLECGRCTFHFWRRISEFAQLQRDTLFAECPRCDIIIDIDEGDFEKALKMFSGIRSMERDLVAPKSRKKAKP